MATAMIVVVKKKGTKEDQPLSPHKQKTGIPQSSSLRFAPFVQTCGRSGLVLAIARMGIPLAGFQLATPYLRSRRRQKGRRGPSLQPDKETKPRRNGNRPTGNQDRKDK